MTGPAEIKSGKRRRKIMSKLNKKAMKKKRPNQRQRLQLKTLPQLLRLPLQTLRMVKDKRRRKTKRKRRRAVKVEMQTLVMRQTTNQLEPETKRNPNATTSSPLSSTIRAQAAALSRVVTSFNVVTQVS